MFFLTFFVFFNVFTSMR